MRVFIVSINNNGKCAAYLLILHLIATVPQTRLVLPIWGFVSSVLEVPVMADNCCSEVLEPI